MKHVTIFMLAVFCALYSNVNAQQTDIPDSLDFPQTLNLIAEMLIQLEKADFAKAVFLSEKAFSNVSISYEEFQEVIALQAYLAEKVFRQNISTFTYPYGDKNEVSRRAAVFSVMMDTVKVSLNDTPYSLSL